MSTPSHTEQPFADDTPPAESLRDLQPFFVLVEDAAKGEIIHPEVQYIFSDDDQELLTTATLNAAEDVEAAAGVTNEHHILIVDMAADGQSITKVSSLSKAWQVTSTEVSQAPSWQGGGNTTAANVMLKLQGMATTGNAPVIDAAADVPTLMAMLDQELAGLEAHMLEHFMGTDEQGAET